MNKRLRRANLVWCPKANRSSAPLYPMRALSSGRIIASWALILIGVLLGGVVLSYGLYGLASARFVAPLQADVSLLQAGIAERDAAIHALRSRITSLERQMGEF